MNDAEREDWVNNDEGLYRMWKRSRQSMRAFVRDNRAMLTEVITNVRTGAKPAHYLEYGP